MRFALVLSLLAACAAAPPAPTYPLHPLIRSASGGPIEVSGEVAQPGEIPYAPGLTLSAAIRLAGGPTALAGKRVAVTRVDAGKLVRFRVPLGRLVEHRVPDPELAPGDVVEVEGLESVVD